MTMQPSSITCSGRPGHHHLMGWPLSYNPLSRFFLVKSNNAENVSLAKVTMIQACLKDIDCNGFSGQECLEHPTPK